MTTRRRFRARPRHFALAVFCLLLAAAPSITAAAAWSLSGSGLAGGSADTMPNGLAPTAAATRNVVSLRWPAVTLTDGTPVAGYVITRTNAVTGTTVAAGGTCSGTVTTTACTDAPVPPGTWTYDDSPVQGSWTGAESPQSNTVTVPLT